MATNEPGRRGRNPLSDATVSALTDPGAWLDTDAVCALIGESVSTLEKWRRRPEVGFPAARRLPNGKLRWRRDEVAAWLLALPQVA